MHKPRRIAQRSAIRSQCRSDYIAHCSSVPPGGIESLQCLQKNMSSLSASCKSAVNAVEAPAAAPKAETPKAETPAAEPAKPAEAAAPKAAEPAKTTAPAAKTAASAPAKKPSDAQVAAIRSACRSDYQKTCAGVPPGGAAALNCLEKNKAKLSPSCEQAVSAASGGSAPASAAAPASGGAAAASPAAPAAAPADGHRFAADAAARGIVRAALGVRCRRPRALRGHSAWRRPYHAVSGDTGGVIVACVQGRPDVIAAQ